jgi:hypothetical protein
MDHDSDLPETNPTTQADLVENYRQITADAAREMEAEEWTEQILFEAE